MKAGDDRGASPTLAEASGWVGLEIDDAAGRPFGRVHGIYADAETAAPAWLVVAPARRSRFWRRRASSPIVVSVRECAAMPARVWTAQPGEALRGAPPVDPDRPLLREHEVAICAHYGIGERVGRHAEITGRPEGTVTARPA